MVGGRTWPRTSLGTGCRRASRRMGYVASQGRRIEVRRRRRLRRRAIECGQGWGVRDAEVVGVGVVLGAVLAVVLAVLLVMVAALVPLFLRRRLAAAGRRLRPAVQIANALAEAPNVLNCKAGRAGASPGGRRCGLGRLRGIRERVVLERG